MPARRRAATRRSRRQFLKASAALGTLALAPSVYAAGSDTIKVGLIGCGGRGPQAARNAVDGDPGVKLVAMCDLFMDRIKKNRDELKAAKGAQVDVPDERCFDGFDGYKKVIAGCDVVLIACAAKFHPMYMTAVLEAGKHVFVEKPHAIDPAGIKVVTAACELGKQKKLCVLSGLHSRWHPGYQETIKRIHDGAIGDIVTIEENFLRPPYGLYPRTPGRNEVQFQCGNQYHFNWLCGDDVPQSLIHNVDRSLWALREQTPTKCHGLAGRSTMVDEVYGNVFDHHSVVYEFDSGVRLYAFCRTTTGCYDEYSSKIYGTKGRADLMACSIEGETKWKWGQTEPSPHALEIKALLEAIRAGRLINSGYHMVSATHATIMGQISCYTGREVTWKEVERSKFYYPPTPQECSFEMTPPTSPGPEGHYPVYKPGQTMLLWQKPGANGRTG